MKKSTQLRLLTPLASSAALEIASPADREPKLLQHFAFGLVLFSTVHLVIASFSWMTPLLQAIVHLATVIYYSCALWREPSVFLTHGSKRGRVLAVSLIALVFLVLTFCLPASAQFYRAAEDFFQSSFPQATTAIPLLFNALRGIFIIYVGIALIGVLRAFQQGEDWLSVARSPAVVVVVVALGDVLTAIIIG
ncbi:MAG: hypothetical protein F6K00_30045 [Leptolyngbya sp. SIOISBB]|nr:hypothetical protein [Leptolyngbya sp. SIOISBB]